MLSKAERDRIRGLPFATESPTIRMVLDTCDELEKQNKVLSSLVLNGFGPLFVLIPMISDRLSEIIQANGLDMSMWKESSSEIDDFCRKLQNALVEPDIEIVNNKMWEKAGYGQSDVP